MKPVHVFIGGQELLGYTEMTLSRSKDQLTGNLSLSLFMGYMPESPVLLNMARGQEVLVYIGGHLAFTGVIDRRQDTGAHRGDAGTSGSGSTADRSSRSLSIGPNEYTVKMTSRGKTKYLVDSSHQHPTTNMMRPTNREAFQALVDPWGVELEWMAQDIDINKLRFRDGARVVDELHRLALEHSHYIYETRDGRLRITDGTGGTTGEPIVLGTNILQFSTEQAEDRSKSRILVKGQRIEAEIWGEDALLETVVEVKDAWVDAEIPIIVQHYGNATPEALERRATYEANKRSAASKKVTLDVFHVQSTGEPWDIGQVHYIEIPPAGVFDVMECTELTYTVQNDKTLKTSMTFSPLPTGQVSGGAGGPTSNLPELTADNVSIGNSRRAAKGVTFAPGQFPAPWSGPQLSVIPGARLLATIATGVGALFDSVARQVQRPPRELPPSYRSEDEE
ncbi:baseplate hub protein [Synechococcus phage Ssp-JY38]|nr:tail protein [Synechococcus phage Yong-L2-223]